MKFRQNNKDNINLLGHEILNIETKKIKPLKQSVKLLRKMISEQKSGDEMSTTGFAEGKQRKINN